MGVRLTRDGVTLQFLFDLIQEDCGTYCYTNPEYETINSNWLRVENESGYFYSTHINEDEVGKDVQCGTRVNDQEKSLSEVLGNEYAICDHFHGATLMERPSTVLFGNVALESAIRLRQPMIIGDVESSVLQEIDQIIQSIVGLNLE